MPPTRPGLHADASGWMCRVPKVAPPVCLGMEEAGRTAGTSAWAQHWELPQGGRGEGHGSPPTGRKGSLREGRRTMARPALPGPKTQTDAHERPTRAALFRHFTVSSALPMSFAFCFGPDCSPQQLSPEEEQPGAGSSSPTCRAPCARRSSSGNPLHKASEAIAPEGLCEGTG